MEDEVDYAYSQLKNFLVERPVESYGKGSGFKDKKKCKFLVLKNLEEAYQEAKNKFIVRKKEEERLEKLKLVVYEGEFERESEDFYKILGVKKGSTTETIAKVYRKLALEFHPDKNKSRLAEVEFKKIKRAYEVLSDE
ncbi:2714_t:CDS:1, partial [Paraglomus occultum]